MRKIVKQIIGFAVGLGLMFVLPLIAAAAPFLVQQGGTGVTTITGIPYGTGTSPLGIVTIGSGVSFSGGTLTATGSGGTVTAVSVTSANGFAGSSSGGTTPALTLSTTITGLLKGNGTAISAATAGTDYVTGSSLNTFTNKTYDTAGTGNSFLINGLAATANTGTGSVVRATSPTLITPDLGTPTTLVGTNITGTATGLTSGLTNALKSATTTVNVSAATAPTSGQVLTATSGTTATWQTPTTGTVTSVSGTLNRITSTGGATPVIDISASYVGQNSITTLGTIGTGIWNGTTIAIANGGTGQTTKAAAFDALSPMTTGGDLIYGGASGTGTRLANGSAGQVLTSAGTTLAPTWATPTTGTVTTLSVVSANGFTGSVANPTTTPAITLTTSINSPILSGNGTALSAATTTGSGSTAVLNNTPTLLTPVFTGLPTGSGVASAATASTLASRDANANITANNWLGGYTTTATAAGTTTLTVGSTYIQYFTGSTTQTVTLPVASTLTLGHQFVIVNNSTGAVTINSSGGNAVVVLAGGTSTIVTCILTSGTNAASWSQAYSAVSVASGKIGAFSNTLTLAGTDGTTMTFPTTSATIARTDAANTFTGHQTIEGVTSTGATGTGKFVFDGSPTLVTPNIGAATASGLTLSGITGSTQCLHVNTSGVISGTGSDCGSGSGGLTVGTTAIASGTTTKVLFDNVGVLGEYTISGSGNVAMTTSPVFTTPNLGTPSAATLTNATGLPISTGVSGLAAGIATFLATPSSANLATAVTDETGSGVLVFGTSPTLATPVINGLPTGTGVASAATASTLVSRDANGNTSVNNLVSGFTTTATAAGTTTMTIASTGTQVWTGSSTQTVKLPTTSVLQGQQYQIVNQSTGAVTVQSSGANTITILAANTSALFTAVVATPTTAANWSAVYSGQIITSGKSLSVSNTLILAGTDGTTMTFPTTSKTIMANDFSNASGQLALANGGTAANLTASNGGIVYSTSSAFGILSGTATAGQILLSGSSAAPTWSTATFPSTAGTSGNVLTSNGTNWVSSAPTATTPSLSFASIFESTTRWGSGHTPIGSGSRTLGGGGYNMGTGGTSGSAIDIEMDFETLSAGSKINLGSPTVTMGVACAFSTNASAAGSSFFGIGYGGSPAGTGIVYTTSHAGFKIVVVAGVASLYATQADGATETASAALTTVAANDILDLSFKMNGTSSVDYYWRKNGGAISSATNLAANMPGNTNAVSFRMSNNSTAFDHQVNMLSFSYQR